MRAILPIVMSSPLFISWLTASCGTEKAADYRSPKINALEAVVEKPNPVLLNFTLPDRSKDPTLQNINGYYFRLVGEGANCPAGELIEEVGAYDDANREIKFKVNGKCTYALVMRLGTYQAPALMLTSTINYEDDIKPIVTRECVSCHENLGSYSGLVANADMVLREIEGKTMPKEAPLSDADIAKFLAWKDGGFAEKSTAPLPSAKEQMLTATYYQNNRNDYLLAVEFLGRDTFEIRRSLWIQPAGETAGITKKELLTFGDN